MTTDAITTEEMKSIEDRCEALGVSKTLLMENAGNAIAEFIKSKFKDLKGVDVVVVAGTGNNGGDGFVAARHLAGYRASVALILLGRSEDIRTDEAALNWRILRSMKSIRTILSPNAETLAKHSQMMLDADVIVDAIFGTGVKGQIRDPHSSAIDLVNRSEGLKVAVDLPSGLDPTTGEVHDKTVKANVTITFHRPKRGLLVREDLTGELIVAGIGIPPEAEESD